MQKSLDLCHGTQFTCDMEHKHLLVENRMIYKKPFDFSHF